MVDGDASGLGEGQSRPAGPLLDRVPAGVHAVWDALVTEAPTYLVGGAVRDLVRGVVPHDWDLATALAPERVAARLADRGLRVIPTGLAFGTATVLMADGLGVEVTTFRQDGRYRDGRHPQLVTFTTDLSQDWRGATSP